MQISYGLRAFGIYLVILGALVWFTLDNAVERLNDSMRQSAESVMVDMVNLLAEIIEAELPASGQPNTKSLDQLMRELSARRLDAQIYNVLKTNIDSSAVVTDANGIVLYDSTGNHVGADFSNWNDIIRTLEGEYGARTSYINRSRTEPDDPKAMYIAAPIRQGDSIVGVVSLAKPINSLETHLIAESEQLQRYAFFLLLLALVIGYLLSLWFTWALGKIRDYANAMAAGRAAQPPAFMDSRLSDLSDAVTNLRRQVDGKKYVENYIHSLTHELKTPLTSIGATVELLREPMDHTDQERFFNNLANSNERMSQLVDRMLSLAQLEGLDELVNAEAFNLTEDVGRLTQERKALAAEREILINTNETSEIVCQGDRVLLNQAIGNLLDNALRFCQPGSTIQVELSQTENLVQVQVNNTGEQIPDYALSKVFDRFFSLPSNADGAPPSRSTGLGLSFVREIMKLHDGSVSLSNTKGGVAAVISWPN